MVMLCFLWSVQKRAIDKCFVLVLQVQDTLKSGNFMGIINVLMQLRKVSILSKWQFRCTVFLLDCGGPVLLTGWLNPTAGKRRLMCVQLLVFAAKTFHA